MDTIWCSCHICCPNVPFYRTGPAAIDVPTGTYHPAVSLYMGAQCRINLGESGVQTKNKLLHCPRTGVYPPSTNIIPRFSRFDGFQHLSPGSQTPQTRLLICLMLNWKEWRSRLYDLTLISQSVSIPISLNHTRWEWWMDELMRSSNKEYWELLSAAPTAYEAKQNSIYDKIKTELNC